jgi:hypothetical protein
VRLVTEQRQLPAPGSGRITGRCLQNPTRPVGLTLVEPSLFFFGWLSGLLLLFFFLFAQKLGPCNLSLSLSLSLNHMQLLNLGYILYIHLLIHRLSGRINSAGVSLKNGM